MKRVFFTFAALLLSIIAVHAQQVPPKQDTIYFRTGFTGFLTPNKWTFDVTGSSGVNLGDTIRVGHGLSLAHGSKTDTIALAYSDTLVKGGAWFGVSAVDSFYVFEDRELKPLTVTEIRAIRVGGTSASISVQKNNATNLLIANYAVTTSMASAGTPINNTLAQGDLIVFAIRAVSGTVTQLFIQITLTRSL